LEECWAGRKATTRNDREVQKLTSSFRNHISLGERLGKSHQRSREESLITLGGKGTEGGAWKGKGESNSNGERAIVYNHRFCPGQGADPPLIMERRPKKRNKHLSSGMSLEKKIRGFQSPETLMQEAQLMDTRKVKGGGEELGGTLREAR